MWVGQQDRTRQRPALPDLDVPIRPPVKGLSVQPVHCIEKIGGAVMVRRLDGDCLHPFRSASIEAGPQQACFGDRSRLVKQ